MKVKVLSLFDGISCGRVALERAGFEVERYVAYEIDEAAIIVSEWNYPDIEHRGSVVGADFTEFAGFDLVIGGSPCQGFSFAGKQLNFDDPRSALFFEFVRALEEVKPAYFLLENVVMKKDYEDIITSYVGVSPIKINSSTLSAGLRSRLYWSNIPGIEPPKPTGLTLQSILKHGYTNRDKSLALLSNYNHGSTMYNARRYFGRNIDMIVFRDKAAHDELLSVWQSDPYADFDREKVLARPLLPVECERIQTLPDHYTDMVPTVERYRQLGNGWTVDVIAHILRYIHDDIL